jgi:hypothetical protein
MIKHIDQILDENKPVWVRNVYRPRGQIVLAMHDRSNQVIRVVLPPVNHPVCLTDRVTPEVIRNSTALRDLIGRKVVELVTPEEANRYYEVNPHAREDVNRAYDTMGYNNPEIRKMRETGTADDNLLYHKQGESFVAGKKEEDLMESDDSSIGELVSDSDNGDVQPRVKVLMEALSQGEKKPRAVRSDLDSLDLTAADLAYIAANSTGLIEKYAKQEYAARHGGSLDIIDDSSDE